MNHPGKKFISLFLVFFSICLFAREHKHDDLLLRRNQDLHDYDPFLHNYRKYDVNGFSHPFSSGEISHQKIFFNGSKTFHIQQHEAEWEPIGPSGVSEVSAMAVAPSSPNIIYTDARNASYSYNLYRSEDFGKSWEIIFGSPERGEEFWGHIVKITINPYEANQIFILTIGSGFISQYIARSTDGGITWNDVFRRFANYYDLIISKNNTMHILVAAFDFDEGLALYKSLDGGGSWNKYFLSTEGGVGYAVAIDPNNDDIIYVGGDLGRIGGLFKTLDGGDTWTEIGRDISGIIYEIVVDPNLPDTIYVGTNNGVFKSEDSGLTWAQPTLNFDVNRDCIKIYPDSTNEIFAGGDHGVYFSDDGGDTWQEFNSGLLCTHIMSLDMDPAGIFLYARSSHEGIYKRKLIDSSLLAISAGIGGTTDPLPGIHIYDVVTDVTVKANPDTNHKFSHWSGDVFQGNKNDNPLTVTVDSDKYITANFTKISDEDGDGGGGCFLSQATSGSPLQPYMATFRGFRDQYLVSNSLGRKLVDSYHKYSPFAANLIAKHKVLKIAVRFTLLPIIAVSYLMLHLGPVITAFMLVFVFVLPIFLISFRRKQLRRVEAKFPNALASRDLKKTAELI